MKKVVYIGPHKRVANRFGKFSKNDPVSVSDEVAELLINSIEFEDAETKTEGKDYKKKTGSKGGEI